MLLSDRVNSQDQIIIPVRFSRLRDEERNSQLLEDVKDQLVVKTLLNLQDQVMFCIKASEEMLAIVLIYVNDFCW